MYIGYDIAFPSLAIPSPEEFINKFKIETGLGEVLFIKTQEGYYKLSHADFPEYEFVICFPTESTDYIVMIWSHTPIIHYLLEATATTLLKLNGQLTSNSVNKSISSDASLAWEEAKKTYRVKKLL